ncbi:hypothetical protein NW762_000266 [Fusarium torreyae]|uniref:Uncharacterized protein n=1 Tax=Fusarium torreyae TaxID=1237075 RepID=A0A9W8SJ32_9HYPO|nr:hypothetical protein NW762_000266 [Fusarium torreyae]
MASRRSQFVDAQEAPEYYRQEPGYFYQIPQTPPRTMRPPPVRVSEDHYSQMYASPAPTTYIIPCCRRRRRSSRHSRAYDSDESTDSYLSYENIQTPQPAEDRLPPRIALQQLSEYLYDATVFYNTQLIEFSREHQRQGHDTTNEPLRQWLWNDWMNRRDKFTRENFTSTKTSVTLLLRQVETAVATPWLEDADLQARFEFTFKTLQASCGEVVRWAARAMVDWQACRFLAVELKNARMYANPEGSVQRPIFDGWDNEQLWQT